MKRTAIQTLVVLVLAAAWIGRPTSATPARPFWATKITSQVLSASRQGNTEFLIILREQANLSHAETLNNKLEKGAYVFKTLTEFADRTQGPLRSVLETIGVDYKPFWVANMIWVRGDYNTVKMLALREDVAKIEANPSIPIRIPQVVEPLQYSHALNGIEWNISKINAPRIWALGHTGQGILIGGQDTGYLWDHPALIEKYHGWDGSDADHNYSWHDAIGTTYEPVDPHGHGTLTMGVMVGDDGEANHIGVAPGAEWIGCRNMDSFGRGSPASYTDCYQWFIAPTDLNGENPDPAKAPDVINNSWSCTFGEGCEDPNILLSVVQAVRAAGIVTVHAAGNAGGDSKEFCGTVNQPAAIYAESFSVGATNYDDTIWSLSSRGPVTIDGSDRLKPNVTAPGSDIRSSSRNYNYTVVSGTSMAAPHVAGLAALLFSANPNLIGQVDKVEDMIENTALPLTTDLNCGEFPGSSIPNTTYGFGRVDAWAALHANLTIFFYPFVNK